MTRKSRPSWFTWILPELAIGSDQRYRPWFYERRAYYMGLRDAARIAEHERWLSYGVDGATKEQIMVRMRLLIGRKINEAIHAHTCRALGVKSERRWDSV